MAGDHSDNAILWAWISAGTLEQKRKKVDAKNLVISGRWR